jgi:hypothetical protein
VGIASRLRPQNLYVVECVKCHKTIEVRSYGLLADNLPSWKRIVLSSGATIVPPRNRTHIGWCEICSHTYGVEC